MPENRCIRWLLLFLLFAGTAFAQERYPARPIKIVVALGPGSAADALARILAEALRPDLKTDVIVENRAGAGGIVGGDFVARAKPDGYTVGLFHASVVTTVAAITPNLPYDPAKDFSPLGMVGVNQLAFVVSAGSRWKTLEEFLEEAKRTQGKLGCGIIGVGSHSHFNLELLKIASGAEITRVPYSAGTGAVITALLGGHIDCTSLVWPAVSAQVKAGKFRALAATSPVKGHPEIPTFADKGVPRASLEVFFALFAPAALPREAADRLVPAIERAARNPQTAGALEKMGFSVVYEGPQQLGERMRKELEIVREVAKKAGIRQE